ncbi:uncharacterized protein N7483_009352 [Penicillium malachiteum]|uniref:uncharacterized protein n=1 Tax=Penicillium malachiteum TaxID=1324776 RepID=UPI002546E7FD|nr:uncharacterized protein N7483_009352 [Penicillium malachiteum]KAJ5721418.1 hypothetical protein N7483_009352 [Penicillium malachiteum]
MKDIGTYIESSIADKTMCGKITDDLLLIQKIQQRLLIESSGMFLWVYLQLEILWDTCHTDAAIRSALSALPRGLEETYSCCIERINQKDNRALKVLKWVSFATRPLHIEELREAVAFGSEDLAWNAEKVPRQEFVIGCCANLVVVDATDYHVRFAHSSVEQYLEKGRERKIMPWYPTTAQGVLECGEFCLTYLSFSDFSLQLSMQRNEKAAVAVSPPILLAQQTLPRLLTRKFSQWPRNQKPSISVQFREIRTSSKPNRMQYKFLAYAVTNWALQTKKIRLKSSSWYKFEQLAMCFNETWNFHPWTPGGRSFSSHLHSLFGWAVKEQHKPLLLPALHVAAKLGYKDIVEILLGFCKVNMPDLEGYTALHHAASKGHIEPCKLLLKVKLTKMHAASKSQCTPLWLAASNGHEDVVSFLTILPREQNIEAEDTLFQQTPLSRAAQNGHTAVVEHLLRNGAQLESKDADGRTSLWWAVEGWHEATMKMLLGKGAKIDIEDFDIQTLLLWATENGHKAIVSSLVTKVLESNFADHDGLELLIWAIEHGQGTVANILLDNVSILSGKLSWVNHLSHGLQKEVMRVW